MTRYSSRRDFLKSALALASAPCLIDPTRLRAADLPSGRRYVNIAPRAGINFIHNNGEFGKKYLPETMGSGCAFIDYNNDGQQDIFFVNSMDFPGHFRRRTPSKLYRNNGNGTFTDVSRQAGLDVEMYGLGVAVGDYDNDGWDDLYITGLGEAKLFHNEHGRFRDVTGQAGVNNTGFGASAVWFDYDRDGWLDLFVCNYVRWSEKGDIYCSLDGHTKSYCIPSAYNGESCRLFHNLRNGRFEDVTQQAGIYDPAGKNLGVAIIDYNNDGWPDIVVADDTQPNKLYRNNRNGTFTDIGIPAGIAYDQNGVARSSMGIAAGDFDRTNYAGIVIGNFSNQMLGLYENERHGLFINVAPQGAIGQDSRLSLTFGLFFYDYDLDGLMDIFAANGNIDPTIVAIQPQVTYAERPLLFRNQGQGRFEEVGIEAGLTQKLVARGAAYADINNDGYLDVLLTTNHGPAYLFENTGPDEANAVRIRTVGTRSNRDGIDAVVSVQAANGVHRQRVHSGSSYCSQSELPLTFGLGRATMADVIQIEWPSGHQDTLKNLKANASYVIQEGGKILARKPFRR
jgi:enediyne biosynthesis protein E4